MHLIYAFIQSDLKRISVVCVYLGNQTHKLCAVNSVLQGSLNRSNDAHSYEFADASLLYLFHIKNLI